MSAKSGVLERVLGSGEFKRLCPAVRKHYNISGDDRLILRGVVEHVELGAVGKLFAWAMRAPEAAVAGNGASRCEMNVWCGGESRHAVKTLHTAQGAPGKASSKVAVKTSILLHKGELVEMINSCVGVRLAASVTPSGSLVLRSTGFVAMLGPFDLYLPLFLLPYCAVSYEETDATTSKDAPGVTLLRVSQTASHPLFGTLLGFTGTFKINAAKMA